MSAEQTMLPPLLPIRALDARALVRLLSSPSQLPQAYHVRNRILHAFLHRDGFPPRPGSASTLERAWDVVLRDGYRGWAIGAVPDEVLVKSSSEEGRSAGGGGGNATSSSSMRTTTSPGWGVFFLHPGIVQGSARPTPRLDVWLSRPRPSSSSPSRGSQEDGLMRALIERIVPRLLVRLGLSPPPSPSNDGQEASKPTKVRFLCCSVNYDDAECVRAVQAARPKDIALTLDNRCYRFLSPPSYTSTTQSPIPRRGSTLDGGGGADGQSGPSWELGLIEEGDIADVIATNKIPYPPSYVREHMHISSLVRLPSTRRTANPGPGAAGGDEGRGFEQEKDGDALDALRAEGKETVGWSYTHSNLFLAFLYVKPAYRKTRLVLDTVSNHEAGAGASTRTRTSIGIGTLIVQDLTHKLIQTQRAALAALDLNLDEDEDSDNDDDDYTARSTQQREQEPLLGPCTVNAESEIGNTGAHAFFVRGPGFVRVEEEPTWMIIEVALPPRLRRDEEQEADDEMMARWLDM